MNRSSSIFAFFAGNIKKTIAEMLYKNSLFDYLTTFVVDLSLLFHGLKHDEMHVK